MSKVVTGKHAIEIARVYGIPLHRYPGPSEPACDNLTVDEAVAELNKQLIWVMVPALRIHTASGRFRVYHREEAFNPDVHQGGPWFFAPIGYMDSEAYSQGYATVDAALEAAEAWEKQGVA